VSENWSQTEELVRKVITERMGIDLVSSDIERAHRLGRKSNNRSRPIIIKFSHYKLKSEVLRRRSKLAGSKFWLDEDFTSRIRATRNE
jgi:hypothetical protein